MVATRALLGVELWRIYAEAGRLLPAAWVARAVGVSPTTMIKYLAACPEYRPQRGYTPGVDWNWWRGLRRRKLDGMETQTCPNENAHGSIISNGQIWEFGPPLSEEECAATDSFNTNHHEMDFAAAMEVVDAGLAVARMADCERVFFKRWGADGPAGEVCWGTSDDEGTCTPAGVYAPTDADRAATDWMVDAHCE